MLMRMFVANEVAQLGGWLDWVAKTLPYTKVGKTWAELVYSVYRATLSLAATSTSILYT